MAEHSAARDRAQVELNHIVAKSRHAAMHGTGVLSTGERLAAALVLNRPDWLARMNYTLAEAVERVGAEWLALIPQAAKQLAEEAAQDEARRAVERAEAVLGRPAPEEAPRFHASYVTHGYAPGYRNVSFWFDLTPEGSARTQRVEICIRPEDAGPIVADLRYVHRFAWRDARNPPLDAQPGEQRPAWIDASGDGTEGPVTSDA